MLREDCQAVPTGLSVQASAAACISPAMSAAVVLSNSGSVQDREGCTTWLCMMLSSG